MFCPNCGAEKQKRGQYCTECGKPLKAAKGSRSTFIISLMALLIALAGTGLGIFFLLNKKEEPVEVIKADIEPEPVVKVVEKVKEPEPEKKEEVKAPEPPKTKSKTEVIKGAQDKVFTIFTDSNQGSGFLFSNKGDVVTNAHVVAGFTDVLVKSSDGTEYQGQVIGISDVVDIALIRVDPLSGKEPLPAEMTQTAVGTEVIALGSPRGLENTASVGYLTGIDRDILGEFNYEKVYQIDAQISPGSSGGPLLDATTGKVIGINSAVLIADQSIGFSIPMFSVHNQFTAWSQNPMSAEEVSSLFGFYDEYYDYWQWDDSDWEYNEDDYYDWESDDSYEYENQDGGDEYYEEEYEEPVDISEDEEYEEELEEDPYSDEYNYEDDASYEENIEDENIE
ncbi:trypsin-like peptidase domain-containing protein [Siminovitchia acidinfaciens]|nr:trypsin-like peptidase domain-containing protein [Siminovitchia acidinfaciens]